MTPLPPPAAAAPLIAAGLVGLLTVIGGGVAFSSAQDAAQHQKLAEEGSFIETHKTGAEDAHRITDPAEVKKVLTDGLTSVTLRAVTVKAVWDVKDPGAVQKAAPGQDFLLFKTASKLPKVATIEGLAADGTIRVKFLGYFPESRLDYIHPNRREAEVEGLYGSGLVLSSLPSVDGQPRYLLSKAGAEFGIVMKPSDHLSIGWKTGWADPLKVAAAEKVDADNK